MSLKEYDSLLRNALYCWYFEKCKFPKDEAKYYSDLLVNMIYKEVEK